MAGTQPAGVYRSLYAPEVSSRDQNHPRKQRTPSISGNSAPKHRHKPQKSKLNWNIFLRQGHIFIIYTVPHHVLASLVNCITEQHHRLDRITALTLLYAFTTIGRLIRYISCARNS